MARHTCPDPPHCLWNQALLKGLTRVEPTDTDPQWGGHVNGGQEMGSYPCHQHIGTHGRGMPGVDHRHTAYGTFSGPLAHKET